MVGPKKQAFWPRISILKEFFFNPLMNYSLSKSAKIVLSKFSMSKINQRASVKVSIL